MTVFGTGSRGAFRAIEIDASGGNGVQLTTPGGLLPGASSLVTSFSVTQGENIAVSQCLNGGIYLYTFGHDPQRSQFSVGITSFLNTCEGDSGATVADAISAYRKGRVSVSKQLSNLTVGRGAFRGYLIGQSIDVADTQLSIISTTYNFIALNAHGSES